mmetsp:Transcript_47658/g.108637  ORF Transcript_47658/g.108637 Transcript_47658/m.108637 type:complete len:240 (+) Transcript_47658:25-744(+)
MLSTVQAPVLFGLSRRWVSVTPRTVGHPKRPLGPFRYFLAKYRQENPGLGEIQVYASASRAFQELEPSKRLEYLESYNLACLRYRAERLKYVQSKDWETEVPKDPRAPKRVPKPERFYALQVQDEPRFDNLSKKARQQAIQEEYEALPADQRAELHGQHHEARVRFTQEIEEYNSGAREEFRSREPTVERAEGQRREKAMRKKQQAQVLKMKLEELDGLEVEEKLEALQTFFRAEFGKI